MMNSIHFTFRPRGVNDEKLPVDDEKLPFNDEKLPVNDEKLPVTDEKLPVTDEKLQCLCRPQFQILASLYSLLNDGPLIGDISLNIGGL